VKPNTSAAQPKAAARTMRRIAVRFDKAGILSRFSIRAQAAAGSK
jgi:hypothetical protein